jgi:hypothetical protein
MDVSGASYDLDAGHPCRHDEDLNFMFCGRGKIMKHFAVNTSTLKPKHQK